MGKIYSYVLRYDDGAAPNPFWDTCTLAICKPTIRRKTQPGDWVIGTGSKNSRCNDGLVHDLSDRLVYAVYSVDDDPGFRDVDPPAKQAIRIRA
jgi:Nucleotide modification associated domain 2